MLVISIIVLFIVLLLIGMPIGFAMGIAGTTGLILVSGFEPTIGILQTTPYRSVASYILSTIPMFILMAEFSREGNIVQQVFRTAYNWVGHLRGGLAYATVFASAILAAIMGSSTASAATLASAAIPEMNKYGYNVKLSAGVVSIAGTLAIMIPPSVAFIIYGVITETSIGKLLIAGILPGVLTAIGYCLSIFFWIRRNPEATLGLHKVPLVERMNSLKYTWPMIALIILVLGGIYFGVITPIEAGAVGALGAFVICLVLRYIISGRQILTALGNAVEATTMIFTIMFGAMIFGYFLAIVQLPQQMTEWVSGLSVSRWWVLGIIIVIYLILGMFMDQIAILLLTLPLTFPLIISLGFDPIWFGVVVTKVVEIGLVTPPVGMNIYIVSNYAKIPMEQVFQGTLFFLIIDFIVLFLLILFPSISLYLPSLSSAKG